MECQVILIQDFKLCIIMVILFYLLLILDEFCCQGFDLCDMFFVVGIFGVEFWINVMCQEIEVVFDMYVVDIYGLLEVFGLGVVNECVEIKDGLYIWEDYFYLEIIDLEIGEVLFDGEMGEFVFMMLIKEGLLMIWYRMWDFI